MDYTTILVKVTGVALLIWTIRSIYKHFMDAKSKNDATPKDDNKPSFTETALNNLLLYLWLAFMVIFSSGMILNNQIGFDAASEVDIRKKKCSATTKPMTHSRGKYSIKDLVNKMSDNYKVAEFDLGKPVGKEVW